MEGDIGRTAAGWLVPAAFIVAGGVLWLWLYFRYGEDYIISPPAEPVTEPPYDWTPAQVAFLWNWGELGVRDMVATIVDLVSRGAVSITAEPVTVLRAGGLLGVDQEYEYLIQREAGWRGEVCGSERYLIERILLRCAGADGRASLRETMVEGARDPGTACRRFDQWCTMAEQEPQPVQLEDPVSQQMSVKAAMIGVVMAVACIPLLVCIHSFYSFALVVVGGSLAVGSKAIRRRTREAAVALSRWGAYRNYLAGLPDLGARPLQAFVLGGRPWAYAITFALAPKLVAQFRLLYPDYEGIVSSGGQYPSAFRR